MELVHVKGNTYYIKNVTNIGVYKINESDVYLIDTGNDSEAGKKILKLIEEHGFRIVGIISTHSNADHIGGNQVIQKRRNVPIFSSRLETCFIEHPILEPAFLYGGYPMKALQNKFLLAKESIVNLESLPSSLEVISLKGHFLEMIGIKTIDNVYFLADALFSEETIQKYPIFFLYDVGQFLNTLDYLETLEGDFYILSHVNIQKDISSLIQLNRATVLEIIEVICKFCTTGLTLEELLKKIFVHYQLVMNLNQYALVGSTIKSYLSYLCNEQRLTYEFLENRMIWKTVE